MLVNFSVLVVRNETFFDGKPNEANPVPIPQK